MAVNNISGRSPSPSPNMPQLDNANQADQAHADVPNQLHQAAAPQLPAVTFQRQRTRAMSAPTWAVRRAIEENPEINNNMGFNNPAGMQAFHETIDELAVDEEWAMPGQRAELPSDEQMAAFHALLAAQEEHVVGQAADAAQQPPQDESATIQQPANELQHGNGAHNDAPSSPQKDESGRPAR